jgi:hypothetical protein
MAETVNIIDGKGKINISVVDYYRELVHQNPQEAITFLYSAVRPKPDPARFT